MALWPRWNGDCHVVVFSIEGVKPPSLSHPRKARGRVRQKVLFTVAPLGGGPWERGCRGNRPGARQLRISSLEPGRDESGGGGARHGRSSPRRERKRKGQPDESVLGWQEGRRAAQRSAPPRPGAVGTRRERAAGTPGARRRPCEAARTKARRAAGHGALGSRHRPAPRRAALRPGAPGRPRDAPRSPRSRRPRGGRAGPGERGELGDLAGHWRLEAGNGSSCPNPELGSGSLQTADAGLWRPAVGTPRRGPAGRFSPPADLSKVRSRPPPGSGSRRPSPGDLQNWAGSSH